MAINNRTITSPARAKQITLAFILLAIVLISGCQDEKEEFTCKDCNIILISIDTLRADHLGTYGYQRNTSPNMDEFAKNAIVFEKAYSQASNTAPSHMSMFTSTYPHDHKVCPASDSDIPSDAITGETCKIALPKKIITIGEIMKQNGYYVEGQTDGGGVYSTKGFDRGFDQYFNRNEMYLQIQENESYDPIGDLLIRSERPKYFLFFHTYKTHDPYYPGEEAKKKMCQNITHPLFDSQETIRQATLREFQQDMDSDRSKRLKLPLAGFMERAGMEVSDEAMITYLSERRSEDSEKFDVLFQAWIEEAKADGPTDLDIEALKCLYDGEILEMDQIINRLLDSAQKHGANNTIIIITSDHGEGFGEHNMFTHFGSYNEMIHVPLIIKIPKIAENEKRISEKTRSIDILPTIAELTGIRQEPHWRGTSLKKHILGKGEDLDVYTEEWNGQNFGLIVGDFKSMYHYNAYRFYNLTIDPGEKHDETWRLNPELATKFAKKWTEYAKTSIKINNEDGQNITEDPENLKKLAALGYI